MRKDWGKEEAWLGAEPARRSHLVQALLLLVSERSAIRAVLVDLGQGLGYPKGARLYVETEEAGAGPLRVSGSGMHFTCAQSYRLRHQPRSGHLQFSVVSALTWSPPEQLCCSAPCPTQTACVPFARSALGRQLRW